MYICVGCVNKIHNLTARLNSVNKQIFVNFRRFYSFQKYVILQYGAMTFGRQLTIVRTYLLTQTSEFL